jgi:hypothetical protein
MAWMLAAGISGGFIWAAHSQDGFRHFDSGEFTLKPGENADLTEEHIPLEFVKVWPHPFGNRAINIVVDGQSYSLGTGARIDLKSPYSRLKARKVESALKDRAHCYLEIADFDNPAEGNPQVKFRLDCV